MYFEVLDLLDGELKQHFEQRDLQVAVSLKHLIVSAAEKETVDFLSSIVELYKIVFDFDSVRTQLNMLPDAIQTSGIEEGLTVSSVV